MAQSTRLRFTSDFQLLATAQEAASIATNYVTATLTAPHEILPGFTSPPVRKELLGAKYFLEEEATPKQRGCQSVTDGILFVSQLSGNKKSKLVACNREKMGPIYHRLRQFAQARLANVMVVGVWSPEELPSPNPTVDHLGLCISTISMMELVWPLEVRA